MKNVPVRIKFAWNTDLTPNYLFKVCFTGGDIFIGNHSFITLAKSSEKLIFVTSNISNYRTFASQEVRNVKVFRKFCERTNWMTPWVFHKTLRNEATSSIISIVLKCWIALIEILKSSFYEISLFISTQYLKTVIVK